MKNFKKNIALLAALACAGTMLAGCTTDKGGTPSNNGGGATTTKADNGGGDAGNAGEDAGNAGGGEAGGSDYETAKTAGTGALTLPEGEGKVLNIYCWNEEFKGFVDDFYKVPDGVTINWTVVANEGGAYQNALDQALLNQENAAADDKVDIFLAEADYIIKYANTDLTQDVTKLGVKNWGVGYDYTYQAASDTNGVLKGVSFQATPSVFVYRRSIAKDVIGSDDPADVQAALSTWDKVDEVAQKAKDKGYMMFATPEETYRTFSNNATENYINGDKFALTSAFNQWIEQAEKYVDNGWAYTYGMWSDEKKAEMGKDGKVMCFLGPAWYFNFCMDPAHEPGVNGDWGICVGPQSTFWGGTWLMAATGSDNEAVIADMMNAFTANEDIADKLVGAEQFPNNRNVVNKYANDDSYGLEFLGGQNHMKIMADGAEKITWDPSLHNNYDQVFSEKLVASYMEYLQKVDGVDSRDKALSNFYITLSEVAPQITHD